MKKLFFILTILFFSHIEVSSAQTKCDQITYTPKLIFSTSYGKLRYDNSKGMKELTQLSQKHGMAEHGMFAAGLATVKVAWEVSVSTLVKKLDNKKNCVLPATVEVFIGYEEPTIYLSRDLKPDTCEYNVVLRHEQTHQQINKAALEYYIPELKHHVKKITHNIKPIEIKRTSETEVATGYLTQQYIESIYPLVEAFKRELVKEQNKLDNHSNYKLEGDLCAYYHKKVKNKK